MFGGYMNLRAKVKLKEEETKFRKIRLFYVAMEKFKRYSTNEMCVGHTYGISSPFMLPENMTVEDANKVVSYLTEKVEKENNIIPCTEKSVAMVSSILEQYGFQRIEGVEHGHYHALTVYDSFRRICPALPVGDNYSGTLDLFTVSGDVKLFERSCLNSRYFDWFTPRVSKKEIEDIYKNIGKGDILENAESEME